MGTRLMAPSRRLGTPRESYPALAPCLSDPSSLVDDSAISKTAASNAALLALDGLLYPLIFLTNWSAAASISSWEAGSPVRRSVFMLLHKCCPP